MTEKPLIRSWALNSPPHSHDDLLTLTIWRDRRYQEVRVRVPERSFGTRFRDHRGEPPVPQSARP